MLVSEVLRNPHTRLSQQSPLAQGVAKIKNSFVSEIGVYHTRDPWKDVSSKEGTPLRETTYTQEIDKRGNGERDEHLTKHTKAERRSAHPLTEKPILFRKRTAKHGQTP